MRIQREMKPYKPHYIQNITDHNDSQIRTRPRPIEPDTISNYHSDTSVKNDSIELRADKNNHFNMEHRMRQIYKHPRYAQRQLKDMRAYNANNSR